MQRVETYPVPESALREALLNAVAHKEYGSGAPIQISVYDDKILFWNNGRLPENWTVERLLSKHPSQPFNPEIANAFFRAGMIEAWGRGIEKMQADCEAQRVPEQVLRHETTGLWVEFENRVLGEDTGETSGAAEKTAEETADRILVLLSEDPSLTIAVLSARIGKAKRSIERNLRSLQKAGRLKRIGSAKGGHWHVGKDTGETAEETADRILALLSEDRTLTIAALSARIGKAKRSIERNPRSLQKAGRLKRIGSAKGGHWHVGKDTGETAEKTAEETADRILALLSEDRTLTIAALSARIGKAKRSIERNLRSLQKAGRLKRIGSAKGGHWHVTGDE